MRVSVVRMCAPFPAFLQTNVPAPLSAHSPSPPAGYVHWASRVVPSNSSDTQFRVGAIVVVGTGVGPGVGRGVGAGVGPGEGATVGPGVGRGDGAAVVGACEGSGVVGMAVVGTAVVGWADGMELVGSTVGEGVGTADGTAVVGEKVGPCVGAAVGAQATVAVEDCA